jgi:hypothetical protein
MSQAPVRNVRYWHKADMQLSGNVCFWGKADIGRMHLDVRF